MRDLSGVPHGWFVSAAERRHMAPAAHGHVEGGAPGGIDVRIVLEPERVLRRLLASVALLAAVSTLAEVARHSLPESDVRDWAANALSVEVEASIPTVFSSTLLVCCGLVLWGIARVARRDRLPFRRHWLALALVFFALAADEYLALHERIGEGVRREFDPGGVLHFAWVIPGSLFVACMVVVFWRFVFSLPPRVRMPTMTAATLYLAGALGAEMLGGAHVDETGQRDRAYVAYFTAEETLEMLGAVVFLYALLVLGAERFGGLSVTVGTAPPGPSGVDRRQV